MFGHWGGDAFGTFQEAKKESFLRLFCYSRVFLAFTDHSRDVSGTYRGINSDSRACSFRSGSVASVLIVVVVITNYFAL